jgi:hypothetical protein
LPLRAISSLVLVAAFASCSAIDNFGKFTVAAGVDMAGGGCTAGCNCIAADAALGVPDHCAITPSNGITCSGVQKSAATVTIAGGMYTIDSGASPPVLSDPSGNRVMTGTVAGNFALFCIGSWVADGAGHVVVVGNRPVAIVADSLMRMTNGSWAIAGSYAIDDNGAAGVGGGSNGGSAGNSGAGTNGGHPGVGSPGTGGGGGGSASTGAAGGSAVGNSPTPGGSGTNSPSVGFGGGGGGKGSMNGGGGGGGAGFLQLSAGWAIALDSITFNATGGGGAGGLAAGSAGGFAGGGGGGGGGGVLTLEAPTVSFNNGCLSVVGGPGGAGGALLRGGDSHPTTMCGFLGTGGVAPANGGPGGEPGMTNVPSGGNGTANGGGGGGLGGYGRVTVRSHNPPPITTPPNVDPMAAYNPVVLLP